MKYHAARLHRRSDWTGQSYTARMCLSEHPFVKWHDGAHYLLCKGIEKTSAELGLCFLAYNLRRAINMVGTETLIKAIQG